jgi:hypothetical protein
MHPVEPFYPARQQGVSPSLEAILAKLATRDELQALSAKVDTRMARLDERMDRFEERMDRFEGRFTKLEESILELTRTVTRLDERVRHSAPRTWILGGVVSVLLSVLGAVCWLAQPYVTTLMRLAAASGV